MANLEETEQLLEAFWQEVGIWPCGKDWPAAAGPVLSYDEIRAKAYEYWLSSRAENAKLKTGLHGILGDIGLQDFDRIINGTVDFVRLRAENAKLREAVTQERQAAERARKRLENDIAEYFGYHRDPAYGGPTIGD
jgi:hypothetical protein